MIAPEEKPDKTELDDLRRRLDLIERQVVENSETLERLIRFLHSVYLESSYIDRIKEPQFLGAKKRMTRKTVHRDLTHWNE